MHLSIVRRTLQPPGEVRYVSEKYDAGVRQSTALVWQGS